MSAAECRGVTLAWRQSDADAVPNGVVFAAPQRNLDLVEALAGHRRQICPDHGGHELIAAGVTFDAAIVRSPSFSRSSSSTTDHAPARMAATPRRWRDLAPALGTLGVRIFGLLVAE